LQDEETAGERMRLTPRTILGQLIAGTVVVQLLVFSVFLVFSVRHEFNHTQKHDLERLQKQTGIIAGLVAEPLTKNDDDLMDHVMHAVPIAASVKGARLTDVNGVVLRNTSNDLPMVLSKQELAMLPDLAKNPRYRSFKAPNGDLEGVQPVLADGLIRGIIWVTQDTALALTTPTTVLESLLIYSPFALVGNLLLVWALSGSLARPLRRLRRASQQVQLDPNDLSAFPLPAAENNEAGELTASVNAMVNEIATQRQGTQDTLSLLDSMLTSAPIGFAFFDQDYRYVRVNEELAHMNGVSVADHIGRRLHEVLPSYAEGAPEHVENCIQQVFDTELSVPDDEVTWNDDLESTFRVSYFPVFAGGEVRWVGAIATNITERRRAEVEVRSSEKLAAASRLAASISNEISDPLEKVTNLLYLLRENESLDPNSQEYLAMVQSEVTRVSEITQQTLNFYRNSRAATEVRIADVLRAVLSLNDSRLQASKINVDLRVDEATVLFGYPTELRQLFANLVGNAIDSMPSGGRLLVRVQRTGRGGVTGVHITVAHNGAPLSETLRKRILEPVVEGGHETDRAASSGFWDSDEILMKHRGSIQIRSHHPRFNGDISGTVFRFFFPVRGVPRGPFIVHSSSSRVLATQGV
jgi:PAS domain S-box-containing protein